MKPMLKAFFISRVNSILSRGLSPELQISDEAVVGNLVWFDEKSIKHVEELYSFPTGTSWSANLNAQRFNTWFEDTLTAYLTKRIEDAGIEVGTRIVNNLNNRYSTVTAIRGGTLVLDNKLEVTFDDVVVPVNDEPLTAPMPKQEFIELVLSLRRSFMPGIATANENKVAYLAWTDQDGKEQRKLLYSTTDQNAYRMLGSFYDWFKEALANKAKAEADETPPTAAFVFREKLYAAAWDEVKEVTIISTDPVKEKAKGTAIVTTSDGKYSFAFNWEVDFGELAYQAERSAVTILTGEPRLTSSVGPLCFLIAKDSTVMKTKQYMDVLMDLDRQFGFRKQVYNAWSADRGNKPVYLQFPGITRFPLTGLTFSRKSLREDIVWGELTKISMELIIYRNHIACGQAELVSLDQTTAIWFEWKIDYRGVETGGPAIVSFVGESGISCPLNSHCDGSLMEVLEILNVTEKLTDQIWRKCSSKLSKPSVA